MQSLNRALDLFEYIMASNGKPVRPSELAAYCKTTPASCVRTLKTLTARGYLAQVSRREGYILGPALAARRGEHGVYHQLRQAAQEPLRQLARRFHGMANLSILHQLRRCLLYTTGESGQLRGSPPLLKPWYFKKNATERLLLSTLSAAERRQVFQETGLPDGFASEAELFAELDRYRREKALTLYFEPQQITVAGALFEAPGFPAAAIAISSSDPAREAEAKAAVAATAAAIEKKLALPEPHDF